MQITVICIISRRGGSFFALCFKLRGNNSTEYDGINYYKVSNAINSSAFLHSSGCFRVVLGRSRG
jgi:hypothetical protein